MRYTLYFLLFCATTVGAVELEKCQSAANGQQGITGCYGEEFERMDKDLNKVHQEMMKSLVFSKALKDDGWSKSQIDSRRKQLLLSDLRWKQYREAWCRFKADSMNGSGSALTFVDCEIQMTIQRMEEISK
jgi:uncharacterized protein YecT (DUF1311 family)